MVAGLPFELSPQMQHLSELMELREFAAQAFPDSELRPVNIGGPNTPLEDALTAFLDQHFGFGRPQVKLDTALEELTGRGYSNLQVACFLLKKSSTPGEIDGLTGRYRLPRKDIKAALSEAIALLLDPEQRNLLGAGMVLGICMTLGITPNSPEFPGQLTLE